MRKRQRKKAERKAIAQKFHAAMRYVAERVPSTHRTKNVLWAILFNCDMTAYRDRGKPITDVRWIKGAKSPEPRFPHFRRRGDREVPAGP